MRLKGNQADADDARSGVRSIRPIIGLNCCLIWVQSTGDERENLKCNPVDADDARAAVPAKFAQSLGQTAIPPVGSTDGTLKGNPADADDARFAAAKSVSAPPDLGSKARQEIGDRV